MNKLICNTSKPCKNGVESESDIKLIPSQYKPTQLCRQCLQCGSISGTLGIITHTYKCEYSSLNPKIFGPFVEGCYIAPSNLFDKSSCLYVLQREYGVVSKKSKKYIISSSWATSCVILCMRNRQTTETILAHIDESTIDPIGPFLSFPHALCDVYIVGGEQSSMDSVNNLLLELRYHKYEITYSHIIDENTNDFTINSIDGTLYCNLYDIGIGEIIMEDKEQRLTMIKNLILCSKATPLRKIVI